jgi:1-acyl-sn-glycerol-3-phosphate acyltransferase
VNSENRLRSHHHPIDLDLQTPPETPVEPDPRDQKTYYTYATPLRRIAVPVALAIFHLLARLRIEGTENMPRQGPVIMASNHLTNFDVFPLQAGCPRPIFFMGKAELYSSKSVDWAFRQVGSFPVQRGAHDEWAMRQAERVLKAGQVLGMFPEGHRSKGQGLGPAKTGVARLALTLDCPIVPVGLHGTQYMFKHKSRRTPISVRLGEPLYPEKKDTPLSLTDRIMFAIAGLLPPEDRGVYNYHPKGF